jgi:hypothetical protein
LDNTLLFVIIHYSIIYEPILPSIIALLLQQDDIDSIEGVDEGMMLLDGRAQDHGRSGLKNVDIKAEVELLGRVLHNFGNTTMKKLSKVTQTKVKKSSNTGVCIFRFLIFVIMMSVMMSVSGASSTSLLHLTPCRQ